MAKTLAVAAFIQAVTVASHACIHDSVQSPVSVVSGQQQLLDNGRRLTTSAWAPIRIAPLYFNLLADPNMTSMIRYGFMQHAGADGKYNQSSLAAFVENQLMPAAISRWSSILSVEPVAGALFAHRACNSYFQTFTPARCAALDASVVCETNDDVAVPIDAQYVGSDVYYSNAGLTQHNEPAGGSGLPNADFGIIVTARQTANCGTGGSGTLAYAYTCQRDSTTDRPTWGRINFCPLSLSSASSNWNAQLGVALHELTHALGFSAASWPLFRNNDANRTPRTPRNPQYPSVPSDSYKISYTCNSATYQAYVPDTNTVAYFSERGMSCTYPTGIYPPYNCVHKFVTPAAQNAARYFFNCTTLNGAELENQLTTACDVQGSHWEQRVLSQEHSMLLTPLTLGVLEDSGWYIANYSFADWLRPLGDWGFQQGCSFATSKCLTGIDAAVGMGSPPHFYGGAHSINAGTAKCTTDRRAVGYTAIYGHQSSLPTQYQYFSNPTVGGDSPNVFDYCPAVQAYTNVYCSRSGDASINAMYYGESYGLTSACIDSSLVWSTVSPAQGPGAACFAITCNSAASLTITVTAGANQVSPAQISCDAASTGSTRSVPGYTGMLTCPDPLPLCGTALKYNGASESVTAAVANWPFPLETVPPSPSATLSVQPTPSITSTVTGTPPSPSPTSSVPPSPSATSTITETPVTRSVTPSASPTHSSARPHESHIALLVAVGIVTLHALL